MLSLILTIICGLSFLIGIIVYKKSNHKVKINNVSIACASIVILGLIIMDLIPELIEIGKWWLIIFVILGLSILILLDLFIPHHEHEHHENDENTKDHKDHIIHIGTVTIIALLLHNLVEGMALYSVGINNIKSGILMCVGISLHNIPFGFQIASINENNKNKILILLLVISGFVGGLTVYLYGVISDLIIGAIIAITLGMILHIFLFELLKEVIVNKDKKETMYGIVLGVLIVIIISLI